MTIGTSDPSILRQMVEAWGEEFFPTPTSAGQAKDAAAAHVLRRMAVPHFRECADRIEALEAFVQRFINVGYEFGDPTQLIDLHDDAVALLPEGR